MKRLIAALLIAIMLPSVANAANDRHRYIEVAGPGSSFVDFRIANRWQQKDPESVWVLLTTGATNGTVLVSFGSGDGWDQASNTAPNLPSIFFPILASKPIFGKPGGRMIQLYNGSSTLVAVRVIAGY